MSSPALPQPTAPVIRTSRNPFVQLARGLAIFFLAMWDVVLWVFIPLVFGLSIIWIGLPLVRPLAWLVRKNAQLHRRLALRWNGVEVPEAYVSFPGRPGWFGVLATLRTFRDSTVVKDWVWTLSDLIVGSVLGLLAMGVFAEGVWHLVAAAIWDLASVSTWDSWLAFIYTGWADARLYLIVSGVVLTVAGLLLAGPLVALHSRWARLSLATSQAGVLRARLATVEESRSDAVAMQAEEISRIERDLHDGAQARLVSLGMTLARAERLVQSDPEGASRLLGEAKTASAGALEELRHLVRGIRPPVLADRGLVEALRSLGASLPLASHVDAEGFEPTLPEAVESALYFAGAELMTNAAKHAQAERLDVSLRTQGGAVFLEVLDDGRGPGAALLAGRGVGSGARPGAGAGDGGAGAPAGGEAGTPEREGTGLAGIRRRLGAFDGTLEISDAGGLGTRAVIKVPLRAN